MNLESYLNLKLTGPQKKVLFMALISFFCILIFWFFIYSPAKREMTRLKYELSAVQSVMDKIEKVSGGEKNIDTAYEKLYKHLSDLDKMTSDDKMSAISSLSSEADRMNIEILSIKPEKSKKSAIPIKIDGRSIFELPVSMNVKCSYITLGEYLKLLREDIHVLTTVDSVKIDRIKEIGAPLDIWIDITLYILER